MKYDSFLADILTAQVSATHQAVDRYTDILEQQVADADAMRDEVRELADKIFDCATINDYRRVSDALYRATYKTGHGVRNESR